MSDERGEPFCDAAGVPSRRLDATGWDERWTSKQLQLNLLSVG